MCKDQPIMHQMKQTVFHTCSRLAFRHRQREHLPFPAAPEEIKAMI